MLIDSHCHLNFKDFRDDLEEVIQRAETAGIRHMLTIGTQIKEVPELHALADAHERIFCTIGVHPHEAAGHPDLTLDQLIGLAKHPKVAGIGETGLDFHYTHSPEATQTEAFLIHIEAARRLDLPLVIHSRKADAHMAEILTRESRGGIKGVMHCFSSGPELARAALDVGFYVSFSGILTFRNAVQVREIAAEIPLDRLLIETDAPYLAPEPHRGKRNEPAFVVHTARRLAELRGMEFEALTEAVAANFHRLFSRIPADA